MALTKVGAPHVLGAKGPKRFDCSSLVYWSIIQIDPTLGRSLYTSAGYQYKYCKDNGYLVGKDGDFDQIVSSAVKRAKRNYRDDNSALVWCLPYPTAALNLNMQSYRAYYDEINVYNPDENIHPKAAHQARNRDMVDRSDLVVFM